MSSLSISSAEDVEHALEQASESCGPDNDTDTSFLSATMNALDDDMHESCEDRQASELEGDECLLPFEVAEDPVAVSVYSVPRSMQHYVIARAFLYSAQTQTAIQREVMKYAQRVQETMPKVGTVNQLGQRPSGPGVISLEQIGGSIGWMRRQLSGADEALVQNHICQQLLLSIYPLFDQYAHECLTAVVDLLRKGVLDHDAFDPTWAMDDCHEVLSIIMEQSVDARFGMLGATSWLTPLMDIDYSTSYYRRAFELERKFSDQFAADKVKAFCPDSSKTVALLQALQDFGCHDFRSIGDLLPFTQEGAQSGQEELIVIARAAAFWTLGKESSLKGVGDVISTFVSKIADSLLKAYASR
ncbi:hypothetical protein BOTBODRAFT_181679 [Botryobasidium botryosum FD-172 SS1]|uniref:Uncharacterized protein n=1 Tax=Botryobasidium botryosum (strain FD-172 SS1) TaxID=930990 RepID=A0A067LTH9_BOTB1|nr:hypothetical protein BOTBODRAFT_181679 [Botryobasidium botryosum FD-172 SS1]